MATPALAQRTDRPTLDAPQEQDTTQDQGEESPDDQDIGGLDYTVTYAGDLPDALRDLLQDVSTLEEAREERLPATAAALRRRVNDELSRLEAALKSVGYYAYRIDPDVNTSVQPAEVRIEIEPGPQFTLESYEIDYRPTTPEPAGSDRLVPTGPRDLDLNLGMPAQAAPLRAAEDRILMLLSRTGYPYARIAEARYVADHATSSLDATVRVETGPRMQFGPLSIQGLQDVEEDFVRRVADWPTGDVWDRRTLDRVRQALGETNLFSTVVLEYPQEAPAESGEMPVTLIMGEREHRTISLGGEITSSDEIARATASWEHRNLFGDGESLRIEALASYLRQELRASYRKPYFLREDQDFIARSSIRREESDAFEELTAATSVGVIRELNENWTVELDTALELSEQTDTFGTERFLLVGLPGKVAYDTRDDLLNPTEGVLLSFGATPWTSIGGRSSNFLTNELLGSTYWAPFPESDRLVLAARARFGSLLFAEIDEVPASKRFYAGGGGSVRGYDFRLLGPLDADGDPIGGKSAVELQLEARIKLTDTIGIVPFLDGGQVYRDTLPESDFDWQWAAGIGARYYLGLGPVRLDVAFPINPRGRDDLFEFYISIGQAF